MSVGFCFHPSFLAHDTGGGHPERPQRLQAICEHLKAVGLLDQLHHLEPEPALLDTVELIHPRNYITLIKRACQEGPTALDPDTIASPGSWDAALRAVGAVTLGIDRVLDRSMSAVFCAVRPPGHHALADRAMGFCLFNNVAIGARYAQRRHKLQRIAIVDWDVHHGNGTQAIFEDDPTILYFSTHQYPFYPGTGARTEQGTGAGKGSTINVPLPGGSGDAELLQALEEQWRPKALAFNPELILISAGFDAHRDDPLAGLRVTEEGYARATRLVRDVADSCCSSRIVPPPPGRPRTSHCHHNCSAMTMTVSPSTSDSAYGETPGGGGIVSVLEGGYNLHALAASVEAHLRALQTS